jgi:microcystin-dependent protein
MADQFVAEIRMFAGNFAPVGWAFCNGQIMPISQNTALFSLLGTNYGGNGVSNFALPNLQGVAPIQQGQGPGLSPRVIGEAGGSPTVTLLATELPAHTHAAHAVAGGADATNPAGELWANQAGRTPPPAYASSANTAMSQAALATAGGGQPHNNMPPYLAVNFIIALQGIFPSRP